MTTGPDRKTLLRNHATLNGIDLVVVSPDQTELAVHFINPVSDDLVAALAQNTLDIQLPPAPMGGTRAPEIVKAEFIGPAPNRHLRLKFASAGPFNHQHLTLAHALIDTYFGTTLFNFKAGCPSPFDCREVPECPVPNRAKPLIDYMARDFESYRRVLLDYAETHWPDWQERHLPDVGNMMLDLMAYMGAELAYYQDRVAKETTLESATQRRSARAHARLVDYEIAPPLAAHGWLDMQVNAAGTLAGSINEGTAIWAQTSEGQKISYEVGFGLATKPPKTWSVNAALNAVPPHLFDEDDTCLARGSTVFYVVGALAALLPLTDKLPDNTPVRQLLLRTDPELAIAPESAGAPKKRILVYASKIEDSADPLLGTAITKITLAHPLPIDLDLGTLTLHGNLLPVSAGKAEAPITFVIGRREDATPALPEAERRALSETIERNGPHAQPIHRLYLPNTDSAPLVWTSPAGAAAATPAIEIQALSWAAGAFGDEDIWAWRRSFLGAVSSLPDSLDYTLEDGKWDVVRRFDHLNQPFEWRDYAGDEGITLRFGDGEFGSAPARGGLFRLRYKTGGGAASNLGADTLAFLDEAALPAGMSATVSNPFALSNGADAEPLTSARLAAPEAWKIKTYRAVRPEDYSEAAERLNWVDHAATSSRWTGSWLSSFTTPDPRDRTDLPARRRTELEAWLGRFRMAGRDARVSDPEYADLDFEITICVAPDRERSDVARRVTKRLSSAKGGFFDPNDRSFGTGVERARLEAAIHEAGGVRAVSHIRFRRRGWFSWRDLATRYQPERGAELIRVNNDPARPDRGTLTLHMEGGA